MSISNLLFALIFLKRVSSRGKVGLIISSEREDRYNSALKRVSRFAVADHGLAMDLIIEEHDGTTKGIVQACCRLVAAQVAVVISKGSSTDTALQADILSELHIPIITVSATDPFLESAEHAYLLRLLASEKHVGKAMYELTKHYGWPEVTILATGNQYGINGVIELDHHIQRDPVLQIRDIMIINPMYPRSYTVSKKIKLIDEYHTKIIIVIVDGHYGKTVFGAANEYGLMGNGALGHGGHAFIVADWITSQPENLADESGSYPSYLDGILGIRQKLEKGAIYNALRERFVLAGYQETDLSFYTLTLYDAIGLVKHVLDSQVLVPYTGLECMGNKFWAQGEEVLYAFHQVTYAGVVKDITFSFWDKDTTVYEYEVVNFVNGTFVQIGDWSSDTGIKNMSDNVVFPGGLRTKPSGIAGSLVGVHLHLGTVAEAPFMVKRHNCEGNDCWSGMVNDIVDRLATDLGFTFDYIEPLDGNFGAKTASGQWNGMVGDLISGKIDMIAIDLSVNTARTEAISFSFSFMDSGINAVVRDGPETGNTFFFLEPFTIGVWLTIFALKYLVTVLVWLHNKISPFGKHGAKVHAVQTCPCERCVQHRADHRSRSRPLQRTTEFNCLVARVQDEEKYTQLSFYNAFWTVGTGIVAQAGESIPYSLSGRSLVFSWWAFTLLIISLYTAELTAFLTLSKIDNSLDSLVGLLNTNSKFKWGMIDSRHPQTMLLNHNERVFNLIGKKAELVKDIDEAKMRLAEGNFVFIDEEPVLQHTIGSNCEVHFIANAFQTFEYAFGLPKKSVYKSIIDFRLIKYREEGFMETSWKKWSDQATGCSASKMGDNHQSMDLSRLLGVFFTLIAGVIASVVILLLEFLVAAWVDSRGGKKLTLWGALKIRIKLLKRAKFGRWREKRIEGKMIGEQREPDLTTKVVRSDTEGVKPDSEIGWSPVNFKLLDYNVSLSRPKP